MFTQQTQALAAALALPAGAQQTQALLQVFANCVQGLSTSGPVTINGGAARSPPRAGVISSPPGLGSPVTRPPSTGITLDDYLRGRSDSGGGYPPGTWNVVFNGPNVSNTYGGPVNASFGGDVSYGDTYNSTNNLNDYYTYNNFNNNSTNSVHNTNVSNWYQQNFQDNSYNDFSTNLTTTSNYLTNTYNNIEGDTVFNNTNTTNTTVNQGDVFNLSSVVNEGDVYNEGNTYHNSTNMYINNGTTVYNIESYITTIVNNYITQNGGENGKIPTKATFTGTAAEIKIDIPKYKFDQENCTLAPDGTEEVTVNYTPDGSVSIP